MALFLIPHGAFFDTTWRIFMRHVAHFYAPCGSLLCATWLIQAGLVRLTPIFGFFWGFLKESVYYKP
jgi:hypothetical protein